MYTLQHLLCDEKGMSLPYAWGRPVVHMFDSFTEKGPFISEWNVGELVHLRGLFVEATLYWDEQLIGYELTPHYEGGVTFWFGDTISIRQEIPVVFS